MNYKKLYESLINYCQLINVNERLFHRNPNDYRLNKDYIYQENHHIVPSHDDGLDEESNMVMLLPEEHILAHQLRWKAYKQRGDMLAVRFSLNGFQHKKNKQINEAKMEPRINKSIKQGYIWIKQNSSEVRKTHGWQSEDGRKRISEARKGTMPVRDHNTGEMIGAVSVNHPKVLSGEWAHHTKGVTVSKERRLKYSESTSGEKNPRYSGITDDEIINYSLELFEQIGQIPSLHHVCEYVKKKYNRNVPKHFTSFRFPDKPYMQIMEEKTGQKYNKYKRGAILKEFKQKFKEAIDKC